MAVFQFYARYHTGAGNLKVPFIFTLAIRLAVIQNFSCSFCVYIQSEIAKPAKGRTPLVGGQLHLTGQKFMNSPFKAHNDDAG